MSDSKYRYEPRCKRCKTPIYGEIEEDFGMCNGCLEREAERARERAEWEYYHCD